MAVPIPIKINNSGSPIYGVRIGGGAIPTINTEDYHFDSAMTALPNFLSSVGATYTRNSTKYVLQNGVLVALSANQFGTDQDPVTGLYGYLPETAATNLITRSEDITNVYWAPSGIAQTVGGSTASPDGSSNMIRIKPSASTGQCFLAPVISFTSGTTYTFSIYAKKGAFTFLQLTGGSAAFGTGQHANFDLDTGVVSSVSGGTSHIVSIGNGIYRCSFTVAATGTASAAMAVAIVASGAAGRLANVTGNNADYLEVWGGQCETGPYASSYIKTTGATATRAADVLTVPLANVAGFSSAGYTLFVDCRSPVITGGSDRAAISVNDIDNVTANRNDILKSQAGYVYMRCVSGSTMQAEYGGSVTLFGEGRSRLAMSTAANSFILSRNGVNLVNDTVGAVPVGLDTLHIGQNNGSINQFSGYIFNAKLITRALSQSQINGLTS